MQKNCIVADPVVYWIGSRSVGSNTILILFSVSIFITAFKLLQQNLYLGPVCTYLDIFY